MSFPELHEISQQLSNEFSDTTRATWSNITVCHQHKAFVSVRNSQLYNMFQSHKTIFWWISFHNTFVLGGILQICGKGTFINTALLTSKPHEKNLYVFHRSFTDIIQRCDHAIIKIQYLRPIQV